MIDKMRYEVGALLYTPADNKKIAQYIVEEKFGNMYSLALCLEDTISDNNVSEAEDQALNTLRTIYEEKRRKEFFCPNIFIRVRCPEQVLDLYQKLDSSKDCLCGFIFPKYSSENALLYNEVIRKINEKSDRYVYMMPIIESKDIINLSTRAEKLYEIKSYLDDIREFVLNVRVGGNDFSHQYSIRRHLDETIYDNAAIAKILGDIISVFSKDYVVSGPVWEYFESKNDEWKDGLEKEIKLDLLNGFIGKTVIHPKQIQVVNNALKVTREDYEDAIKILNWDDNETQVGKNSMGQRMNEVKTHYNWAHKIALLAQIYGING